MVQFEIGPENIFQSETVIPTLLLSSIQQLSWHSIKVSCFVAPALLLCQDIKAQFTQFTDTYHQTDDNKNYFLQFNLFHAEQRANAGIL